MSKRVMLIDDEEVFHWITKQFIHKVSNEVDVTSCYNGQEGIETLKKEKVSPDLIMLDLNMPIANGWVFLDAYEKLEDVLRKHTNVYVVSSSIDPEDVNKAKSYPYVKDFISKPVTLELLQELLVD
ncbi:MAG: response regulator [Flavobacteriales bacterium]|nr:response regulator [Flavobacteriales bacterium]